MSKSGQECIADSNEGNKCSIVVVCGSDIAFPNQDSSNFLTRYLLRLKSDIERSTFKALCFSPAAYGTAATIQSTKEFAFAHHTLPCPAIPIPRGADFIGRQVSQVEADVHLPLPDAFRTFQLQQSIRGLQRSGESILLHAHTPGVIGYYLLREAKKRRSRGKPLPVVASHTTGYQPFVETRIVEIMAALRLNHSLTLHEIFAHGGLLERLMPSVQSTPDISAGVERLFSEVRNVLQHWYLIPNSKGFRANKRLGQVLLWIANFASRHSHHRLQGSIAAANSVQELIELLSGIAGVPLLEILQRPSDSRSLAEGGIKDLAGQIVRGYLRNFYAQVDRVLNFEGDLGRTDLQSLGVSERKIADVCLKSNICDQLDSIHNSIISEKSSRIAPRRVKLADFEWGPRPNVHQTATAHLALSDVHLGDGSGTERAIAALELQPHVKRLEIACIDLVGDLIQRDVAPEVSARHRDSFLSAMHLLTSRIKNSDRSEVRMKIHIDQPPGNAKRCADIRRELHRLAIKVGACIDIGDTTLGISGQVSASNAPVFIERGNHDEGERLEEVIPGATVSPSMIRLDKNSGVLFCHGNIWNLPEVPVSLKQSNSLDELSAALTESQLGSSLETAQVIYSMTSSLWRACAKRIDVRSLWKNDLQPTLSRFVQWHRERSHNSESAPSEYSQFLSGVISPVDNATIAAQCGIVMRSFGEFCWLVCDGHSHKPSIDFVTASNPRTGSQSGTLLVNCGKFHGKNITVVLARFPEVVILEWDDREQSYFVLMHRRLSDDEIRIVVDPGGSTSTVPNRLAPAKIPNQVARTLLEICTEGSGHKERQLSLLPLYEERGTVHVAASGKHSLSWAHEHWPGHHMVYDSTGSVRSLSTAVAYVRRQSSIRRKARELAATLDQYSHTITDFAPVLPLAMQMARNAGVRNLPPLYHVSHHAALHSRFKEVPRPARLDRLTYLATQRYLNSISGDVNIGFHFERYHPEILTPPIAQEILVTKPTFNSDIVLVYLNGSPYFLAEMCKQIDPSGEHEWHIYSSQQQIPKSYCPHIWLFPLGDSYRNKLPHARAVLTVSGFMGPAELLHLGKPFMVIPTPGHGEHAFNAAALTEISDVVVLESMDDPRSQMTAREFLGVAKDITEPLTRTGRMGPLLPYEDIRFEVIRKIYGA